MHSQCAQSTDTRHGVVHARARARRACTTPCVHTFEPRRGRERNGEGPHGRSRLWVVSATERCAEPLVDGCGDGQTWRSQDGPENASPIRASASRREGKWAMTRDNVPAGRGDSGPLAGQQPGKGPARGYSWPPFSNGNMKAVTHGGNSERIIAEKAREVHDAPLDVAPYLAEPKWIPAVARYLRAAAREELLDAHVSRLSAEKGAGAVPPRVWEQATSSANLAARLGSNLGLDPIGHAKITSLAVERGSVGGDPPRSRRHGRTDQRRTLGHRKRGKRMTAHKFHPSTVTGRVVATPHLSRERMDRPTRTTFSIIGRHSGRRVRVFAVGDLASAVVGRLHTGDLVTVSGRSWERSFHNQAHHVFTLDSFMVHPRDAV